MRKRLILCLGIYAVTVDSPQKVEAGAFATEFTQLLNHAELVLQYTRQGLQLANEIKSKLKVYFPLALQVLDNDCSTALAADLLLSWPTQLNMLGWGLG